MIKSSEWNGVEGKGVFSSVGQGVVPAVADGGEEICKCKEIIAHSVKTASLLDKHSQTAACSNHSAFVSTMCHFIRDCKTNFKNQKKKRKKCNKLKKCYLNSFFDITKQNVSKNFFLFFSKNFFFYIFCNSKKWPNRNILKISLVQQKDESF